MAHIANGLRALADTTCMSDSSSCDSSDSSVPSPPSCDELDDGAVGTPDLTQPLPQNLRRWAESAVVHVWNTSTKSWETRRTEVVIERKPFSRGGMRAAYRYVEVESPATLFVAKRILRRCQRSQYFCDVKMQHDAATWARRFNDLKPPKPVQFVTAHVIELMRPVVVTLGGEAFLTGSFRKHNSNFGYVSPNERYTPQAFSHFTFQSSGGAIVVCDMQGVGDNYTDPQFHSVSGEGYGCGNLGIKGINRFIKSHVCNPICGYLKLRPLSPLTEEQSNVIRTTEIRTPGTQLSRPRQPLELQSMQQQPEHRPQNTLRLSFSMASDLSFLAYVPNKEQTSIVRVAFRSPSGPTYFLTAHYGMPHITSDITKAMPLYAVSTHDVWGPCVRLREPCAGGLLSAAAGDDTTSRLLFSMVETPRNTTRLRRDRTGKLKFDSGKSLHVMQGTNLVAHPTEGDVVMIQLLHPAGDARRICTFCGQVYQPGQRDAQATCVHESSV